MTTLLVAFCQFASKPKSIIAPFSVYGWVWLPVSVKTLLRILVFDDGYNMILRNRGILLPNYTVSHSTILRSSVTSCRTSHFSRFIFLYVSVSPCLFFFSYFIQFCLPFKLLDFFFCLFILLISSRVSSLVLLLLSSYGLVISL